MPKAGLRVNQSTRMVLVIAESSSIERRDKIAIGFKHAISRDNEKNQKTIIGTRVTLDISKASASVHRC
jgi:hypothetical protein